MAYEFSRCTYVFVLLHDIQATLDVHVTLSYIFYIAVVTVSIASLSYTLGLQVNAFI